MPSDISRLSLGEAESPELATLAVLRDKLLNDYTVTLIDIILVFPGMRDTHEALENYKR